MPQNKQFTRAVAEEAGGVRKGTDPQFEPTNGPSETAAGLVGVRPAASYGGMKHEPPEWLLLASHVLITFDETISVAIS